MGTQGEHGVYMSRREAPPGSQTISLSPAWIPDFQPPGLEENTCLLSKLPRAGYFLQQPKQTNTCN